MFTQSIFKTSIQSLMDKSKFFQCFICLQQFDSKKKFPMQICEKQHFMCLECVQANLFKRNFLNNGYICSLCSCKVETKHVRRSPFLLSIKEFVEKLKERQNVRKQKYKECMSKQSSLCEELMAENNKNVQKISELQDILREQQQLVNRLLQNSTFQQFEQNQIHNSQNLTQMALKSMLQSKLTVKTQSSPIQKQKVPQAFQSMFLQIQTMKSQIEQNENKDNDEYNNKLQELKKHQNFLYEIIENQHQHHKLKQKDCKSISPTFGDFNNDGFGESGNDYPDL